MEKKKKAILISGATKRLGLSLTKQSLMMGFSVIAHYRSTASPLKTWLGKNSQYKQNVYYIKADLRERNLSLIERALEYPVTLVGLINNASLFTEGNLNNSSHFQDIIKINMTVPFLLSHSFYKRVAKGWIINITDANAVSLNKRYQNYRISKIFLTEMTRQQAYLFAPSIRVNAIAPCAILPSSAKERTYYNHLKSKVPLRKNMSTGFFLKAYTYLIENTSVTGQILYVDNGLHLNL